MPSNLQLSLELPLTQWVGNSEYSLVDRTFINRASKLYSGQTLQTNKVRRLIDHLGLRWVCTGCSNTSVFLQEVVPERKYSGETHIKPLDGGRPDGFYTGRKIQHQGQFWVIASRRITLCTQADFRDHCEQETTRKP